MVVIHFPTKFDFDQTNHFLVRVWKRQIFLTMLANEQNAMKRTNKQTE